MTWAAAVISPTVSFLARRPVMRAAMTTGDISPVMMRRMRLSISSWKISRCSMTRCRAWGSVNWLMSRASHLQEVGQHGVAVLAQDGFGVELHALQRGEVRIGLRACVAHAHDLAVVGPGGDGQAVRQRGALNGQGVVTDHGELLGQTGVDALLVGGDDAGLAVHLFFRTDDAPAHGGADALVAQADAEDGQLASEALERGHADAGFVGRAGAGGEHQTVGLEGGDLVEGG